MNYPMWLAIDLYSFVIDLLILFFNRNWRTNKDKKTKLFIWMIFLILILTVADLTGRMSELSVSGWSLAITHIGNYIVFACDPFFYILSMYYITEWMTPAEKDYKGIRITIDTICIANFLAVTASSLFNLKLFYYIEESGIYHRGPLFFPRFGLLLTTMFLGIFYIAARRDSISPKYRTVLIMYPVIGIAGSLLQSVTTQLPIGYVSMTLAALILFVYLQSKDMTEDFLTGSMNRRSLDMHLEELVNSSTGAKTFSGIMVDVDFFKDINDTYGHSVGDNALRDVYYILHSSLRADDSIARYGGDEFFVITMIHEREYLEKCARRIRNRLSDFNEQNERPYKLSLSLGYDIFDREAYPTVEKFVKHLDDLMYTEKELHHNQAGHKGRHAW